MVNPLFPLDAFGRVVLILVAIVIGLIWSMLMWPEKWKKVFGKGSGTATKGQEKK